MGMNGNFKRLICLTRISLMIEPYALGLIHPLDYGSFYFLYRRIKFFITTLSATLLTVSAGGG